MDHWKVGMDIRSPNGANLSSLITSSTSIGGHLRSVSIGFEQQPNGETLQPLARRNLSARAGWFSNFLWTGLLSHSLGSRNKIGYFTVRLYSKDWPPHPLPPLRSAFCDFFWTVLDLGLCLYRVFFFNWASPLDRPPPKFSKCWNHIHFARHLAVFRSKGGASLGRFFEISYLPAST